MESNNTKLFEGRDRATCIPLVAIMFDCKGNVNENYIQRIAGYDGDNVGMFHIMLGNIENGKSHNDPFDWNDRTMKTIHLWLQNHWNETVTGQVLDVEYILGEVDTPKISQLYK